MGKRTFYDQSLWNQSLVFCLGVTVVFSVAVVSCRKTTSTPLLKPSESAPLRRAYIRAVQEHADPIYDMKRSPDQGLLITAKTADFESAFSAGVVALQTSSSNAQIQLRFTGIGRGRATILPAITDVHIDRNRLTYRRGFIEEWYLSGPLGLEQGFIINHRPSGRGKLEIHLQFDGLVSMEQKDDAIILIDQVGRKVLRYADLFALDANSKILDSKMVLQENELRLIVDDARAKYPIVIDPLIANFQEKIVAVGGRANDEFGTAVALEGSTAVIGASAADVRGEADRGLAYVFALNGSDWSLQQILEASDGGPQQAFGVSLSLDGDTVVVGAFRAQGATSAGAGAAYVFTRSNGIWTEQAKLTSNDGLSGDEFGNAVSLDGNSVVVGARRAGIIPGASEGAAYVFVRSATNWTQEQKLRASDFNTDDHFGVSLALSGDTVLVGANDAAIGSNDRQGAVYVFDRTASSWTQRQKLTAADGADDDEFGYSLSVDGDTAVIGAWRCDIVTDAEQGAAYIFVRSAGSWSEGQKLIAGDGQSNHFFGSSVRIRGTNLVVGAKNANAGSVNDAGAAYVFVQAGGSWTEQSKVFSGDGSSEDGLGGTVAIDGDRVLAGSPSSNVRGDPNQGSVYSFTRTGLSWAEELKFTSDGRIQALRFGAALAGAGDTIVVGAPQTLVDGRPNQGVAYVFVRSGSTWEVQATLKADDGSVADLFGTSVDIVQDRIVVGAPDDDSAQGAAYLFTRTGTTWTEQQKITASDGTAGDTFGRSVALSGETAILGAPGHASQTGAAYVFVRGSATWTEQEKLSAGAAGEEFGSALDVDVDYAVVGAPLGNQAWVFERTGVNWNGGQAISGAGSGEFGRSVSISSETIIIGAPARNASAGSVSAFSRNAGGIWLEEAQLTASDTSASSDFGSSLSVVGRFAVIGAKSADLGGAAASDRGAAYLFLRAAGVWTEQQRLIATDGVDGEQFGFAVAAQDDAGGSTGIQIFVGTPAQARGSVYTYLGGFSNAEACSRHSECVSGFCVDGVCCESACAGGSSDCQACSVTAGGSSNGTCSPRTNGTVCRGSAGNCDLVESCDGANGSCPADSVLASGTECRASAGVCDLAETCNGSSGVCPSDALASSSLVCRPSTGVCDPAESCSGNQAACPADALASSSSQCRAAVGECDAAETCDGAGVDCPANTVLALGTSCRPSSGACDLSEVCDGSSRTCPSDQFSTAGTVCRPLGGPCDLAETCDGTSSVCPADTVTSTNTVCRPSAGACDLSEHCAGKGKNCPADLVLSAVTECRSRAGFCDLAEICDGTSAACPADALLPTGSVCRGTAGACDLIETCSGKSPTCPLDGRVAVGTECRPSAGVCDVAESCNSITPRCPLDDFVSTGTECRPGTGICDPGEACTGLSATCPMDALSVAGTECRAGNGPCDLAETCTGTASECPSDRLAGAGTECRVLAGACDLAEVCTGTTSTCPANHFLSAGTECRSQVGACDLSEACDGRTAACPEDVLVAAGTECRPSEGLCDPAESCSGMNGNCPFDWLAIVGTQCRAAASTCDEAETCNGLSVSCTADEFKANGSLCPGGTCIDGLCRMEMSVDAGMKPAPMPMPMPDATPKDQGMDEIKLGGGGCSCEHSRSGQPAPWPFAILFLVFVLRRRGAVKGRL